MGEGAVGATAVREDLRIPEFVIDSSPVAPPTNKADLTQNLQVLTGIGDGKVSLSRQPIHSPLTVSEDVDDLEATAVGQRLRQSRELVKQRCLGCPALPLGRALHDLLRHLHSLTSSSARCPA